MKRLNNTIRILHQNKSMRIWVGHVARMGDMRNISGLFPEGKIPGPGWENSVKGILNGMWIGLD